METSEADFVQRREQFGRRAALMDSMSNNVCEKQRRRESNSELWLKHEHWTSIGRLPVEESSGGGSCIGLWKSGRQGMRTTTGLDCPGIAALACVNARWTFGHAGSQLRTKPSKASFSGFFGSQGGRRTSMKAGSHMGRDCSMRRADGARRILLLGGGSHVGGLFLNGSKSIVIPSSVDMLCKSTVTDWGSVESVRFQTDCRLQRIEKSIFEESKLQLILIPSSVEILAKCCFFQMPIKFINYV
jgi:hypothetical protein